MELSEYAQIVDAELGTQGATLVKPAPGGKVSVAVGAKGGRMLIGVLSLTAESAKRFARDASEHLFQD